MLGSGVCSLNWLYVTQPPTTNERWFYQDGKTKHVQVVPYVILAGAQMTTVNALEKTRGPHSTPKTGELEITPPSPSEAPSLQFSALLWHIFFPRRQKSTLSDPNLSGTLSDPIFSQPSPQFELTFFRVCVCASMQKRRLRTLRRLRKPASETRRRSFSKLREAVGLLEASCNPLQRVSGNPGLWLQGPDGPAKRGPNGTTKKKWAVLSSPAKLNLWVTWKLPLNQLKG